MLLYIIVDSADNDDIHPSSTFLVYSLSSPSVPRADQHLDPVPGIHQPNRSTLTLIIRSSILELFNRSQDASASPGLKKRTVPNPLQARAPARTIVGGIVTASEQIWAENFGPTFASPLYTPSHLDRLMESSTRSARSTLNSLKWSISCCLVHDQGRLCTTT